jgi:beta-mannosidase
MNNWVTLKNWIMRVALCALVVFLFWGCQGMAQSDNLPERINLNTNWSFSEQGTNEWRSATVPGVIHTDLLAHGLIPDPWFGLNEQQIQWVEEKDWAYATTVVLTMEQIQRGQVELVFEGLDTYATIFINGTKIGQTENMYRTYEFEVKSLLRAGENEIRVVFESPVTKWHDHVKNAPITLPASSEMVDVRVSPYVRKAPYHFGWDWGPRYVTCGIWRPVYLRLSDHKRIKDVQINQLELTADKAVIEAEVTLTGNTAGAYKLLVGGKFVDLTLTAQDTVIKTNLHIEKPRYWWPLGWGDPYLYTLNVRLSKDEVVVDKADKSFGLRTIELVQEEDELGRSFYFKVNGHKLFARGANYIPQSNFLPSVRKSQYDSLIADAKAVNMNMIRVWGGGIYEDDYFYELCDKNGILVWQDFMFAGTMYPGDRAFFENVAAEVEQNVKRLRHHPSIAHWNGNNEIEVAWHQWGWQKKYKYSKDDSTLLYTNYLRMFDSLIPTILNRVDPQRSYTPSSPERSYTKLKDIKSGTVHYWGVWHAGHAFEKYRQYIGRFMAEWGFQSFPEMATIRTFSTEADWDLDSEVMKWHQKSPVGNGMIEKQGTNYFGKPKNFEEFVHFSQLTQALAMRVAIDAHRLAEYNSGTLYWQLNDCWPGPSWSTRDVFGRWKEAHKQLEWIYAPVAVLPKLEKDGLHLVALNDLLTEQKLSLQVAEIGQKKRVHPVKKNIVLKAGEHQDVWVLVNKKVFANIKNGTSVLEVTLLDSDGKQVFRRLIDQFDLSTF